MRSVQLIALAASRPVYFKRQQTDTSITFHCTASDRFHCRAHEPALVRGCFLFIDRIYQTKSLPRAITLRPRLRHSTRNSIDTFNGGNYPSVAEHCSQRIIDISIRIRFSLAFFSPNRTEAAPFSCERSSDRLSALCSADRL